MDSGSINRCTAPQGVAAYCKISGIAKLVMTDIDEFKIVYWVVAKLLNIPDIDRDLWLAFGDFKSHGCSPMTYFRHS